MMLQDVNKDIHTHKKPNRLGRGVGTGQGKTAGRGHKGQRARAGYKMLPIFQGGGSPLVRRVPKRGFTNSFALKIASINVGDLEEIFDNGAEVSIVTLVSGGIIKTRFDQLKILGNGDLTKKLTVAAHQFSASAREKIEKAGGKVVVVPGPISVEVKKQAAKEAKKNKKKA